MFLGESKEIIETNIEINDVMALTFFAIMLMCVLTNI